MSVLRVHGPAALGGTAIAPPDKSITHRALILAALGVGTCRIAPAGRGADNRSTAAVLRALGVSVEEDDEGYTVIGVGGAPRLRPCPTPLDCGNSGTTLRLMAGVLAACPGVHVLDGDASLRRRPMARLGPLSAMGATLAPASGPPDSPLRPPIRVKGGPLTGARHVLSVASAQVKSALLLAGLFADGPTTVVEPGRSRDHTERMLRSLGVRLESAPDALRGPGAASNREQSLTVHPRSAPWRVERLEVAPDLSSAAFWLAAAALTGRTALTVRTGVNPTRSGVLDALRAMGVELEIVPQGEVSGEPVADVRVKCRPCRPAVIEGSLTLRSIDELPVLAAVASAAPGRTVIRDAEELKVKETDRIASTVDLLRAFGVHASSTDDGMVIDGGRPLHAAHVEAGPDHRRALTACVLGLAAAGETIIRGAEVIDVSYPDFAKVLARHGARVHSS